VVRLGQNFLADANLLDAIVRESEVGGDDVVLEVGAGEGVLTRRLAGVAGRVHAVEIDRSLSGALADLEAAANVELHWADVMRMEFAALDPPPNAMVANLPYSVATPVIVRTLVEIPGLERWTVTVQREIANRLRAVPGSRTYGAPSAVVQAAAAVSLARSVDPAVFRPRPRVRSAVLRIERTGPAPPVAARRLIREAFAHRRKSLARSLELAEPGRIDAVRAALADLGLPEDARAETLAPQEFLALAAKLA
jgi:16S rRNA (adenine1518-N6/adenine1519-N6)-dimethyltransferase